MELNLPVSTTQEFYSVPTLTRTEFEILHMTILGFSNKEIQDNIARSSHTVKWRLANIYNKFGVKDRMELVKMAAIKGLCFMANGQKQTYSIKVDAIEHK